MDDPDYELLSEVKAAIEADIRVAMAERDPGLLTTRDMMQAAIQSAHTFMRERRVIVERDPEHPNLLNVRFASSSTL